MSELTIITTIEVTKIYKDVSEDFVLDKPTYAERMQERIKKSEHADDVVITNVQEFHQQGLRDQMDNSIIKTWIPISERFPEDDNYILLSFSNFSLPLVGRYEEDENGGAFYIGDDDTTCVSEELFVNAWMPLPEPYRPE